ncbi:M23 family metallopeptidase [Paenibacillus piri]|uniref:M23 family metallopeptidase n=1 Tax=Paenibacillus piri TaxID=2547395 RepID=A0A4R5KQN7_9BACL|nr:M23 family metallopeptidase [Paenibacillus piri]TDF97642.1 M23 family metallopeptidase [Paenibacillus piri]
METRDKVRQRRMERIRQLQEADRSAYYSPSEYAGPARPEQSSLERVPRIGGRENPYAAGYRKDLDRWNDPEYVWKQKMERDRNISGTYRNGDFRDDGGNRFVPSRRGLRAKLVISCMLFAAVWGIFHVNHPWANKGKAFITAALNEPYDFQKVALWYERQFGGTPTLLPALNPVKHEEAQKVSADASHYFAPVKGKVIAPFEPGRQGITLETKTDATVAAVDKGLVVFAGNREDTGYTIIIRHTNGMQTVYGWIEQGKVELNDWIKGGETIGTVSKNSSRPSGYLYFAISKDNKYINPADVVSFD